MICPLCHHTETKVTDSRETNDGFAIRRRRECLVCHFRFSTQESLELLNLTVVKRDGRREIYDRDKLRTGIEQACQKRGISKSRIDRFVSEIERSISKVQKVAPEGEGNEISAQSIGLLVLRGLAEIDEVAYIRFASVYKDFKDIEQFSEELRYISQSSAKEKAARENIEQKVKV